MERLVDIDLIAVTTEIDSIGQRRTSNETTRTLVATLHGISRQEWAVAAQAGLNPEGMAFLRNAEDYDGEGILSIGEVRYVIYRVYPTDNGGIELYYRKNIGVNS